MILYCFVALIANAHRAFATFATRGALERAHRTMVWTGVE